MKQLKLAVIAIFALLIVSSVNAQDDNNPWAISIGMNVVDVRTSGSFGDMLKDYYGTRDWDILPIFSRVSAEKYLDDGFTLQLAGSVNKLSREYMPSSYPIGTENDLIYWSIDANLKYDLDILVEKIFGSATPYFNPFVYVGGSYTSLDAEGEGMFGYGFGFNVWLTEGVGLVYQSGSKQEFADKVPSHYQHSLGVVFKFGGKDTDGDGVYDKDDACPDVAGLKEFGGCPDSDGDGIKDGDDTCPNVAGLAALNGCPDADEDGIADKDDMCPNAKGTKANNGCPDTDGDGVVDKDDKCATLAGPAANGGCPYKDTDNDGIFDKDDKCIDKAGSASNNGCPEPVITDDAMKQLNKFEKAILFNSSKSSFKSGVTETLDGIIQIMKEYPKAKFVIEGHTDNTGPDQLNLTLSEKRAFAVRDYLVKGGVDASRLEVGGFGEQYPIDTNDTRAGRANNRRVDIKVVNEK